MSMNRKRIERERRDDVARRFAGWTVGRYKRMCAEMERVIALLDEADARQAQPRASYSETELRDMIYRSYEADVLRERCK